MRNRELGFRGCLFLAALSSASAGCYSVITVGAEDGGSGNTPDGSTSQDGGTTSPKLQKLDLLVVVDNSNSMRDNQTYLNAQLGGLVESLMHPPCVSDTNPTPHVCDVNNVGDHTVSAPVLDLHLAVVDTDLGTPGTTIAGCGESDIGDDGFLNPIRFGPAEQHHLPWTTPSASACPGVVQAPEGFRPDDCQDPAEFPPFLSFVANSSSDATSRIVHDFRCNAALYVCGCGLEQQLESAWRALIWHGAGGTHPAVGDLANAGFVRDDALLAIVLLTDEEDGSVQNCNYALPGEPCVDHTDVYRTGTPTWASDNPNLRFYLYQPGGAQDPTWPVDRYIDPSNPMRGYLSLKPSHPERVVFAAITGVPLAVPQTTVNGQVQTDWDALLGAPGAGGPNDFYGRNESTAFTGTQAGGPVSMQTGIVQGCTDVLSAACYRADQTYDPSNACSLAAYRAVPSRRIVEVARRFDQAPLCDGQPCHNGMVTSICGNDYTPAFQQFTQMIQGRL